MTFSTRTGRAAALAVAVLAVLSACRSEEKTGATPNNCSKKCSLTETRPLAGFNDGADGFVCGENADSLQLIASAPTWSGRLHEGSHCLQVSGPDMPANRWRTVFREYPEGLDLSDTPFVSFAVHTEGGAYGADYYVRLTVGRGGRKFESMAKVTPKEWNVTIFDLSECPFADRIDRVEFALCNASDSVWENALYQLDGFEAGKPIDLSFGLKGSTELFTAEGGAVSQGDGTLEFAFDEGGSLSTPSLAGSRNGIYNPKLEDRNTMFFVMENRSPADRLRIRFVTAKDSVYNDEKSKIFDIDPNSPKKGYFFNFSDLPQAEGALTGFRIEPLGGAGELSIDRITFEQETVLEPFAGSIDRCTATPERIEIRGTISPEYASKYARIAVYEAPMYKGDRGIEKLKKLYEGPLDRQFVIDDIPTKRNEKMTHLSSRLLAVALNGPDDYLKIAPYFYIENWRDFTDNPYSFELPGLSVSVLDYGAKGDAFTDDTRSIQAAIDDVSSRGGGRVVLPGDSGSLYERRYVATHLMMRSNVDLHIEKGAILWQSQDESDYSYAPAYGHDVVIPRVPWTHSLYVNLPLIQGKDIENVKITGQGKIRSLDTYSVDPRLDHYARVCTDRIHVIPIGFWKVRNIELSDVEIVRTNNYHTSFYYCENLFIGNVKMHEVKCVSGDGIGLSIGTHDVKVARIFLESNDDGIVMTSSYADPRGGVWWWGDNDWDRSVRNVEVCHSYINSGGGKAIALIPWGSTNPDQQKQETDNVNVYDNVLMGGYSVGTWCDNPFDGKPFDNTEENDYAPVKNFRIVNNEYLSPCDLLSIRPTNFITDCGLHSSETFRNGDFAHGHTYWTMEGDAGEQDGSGYARGEGRLYEGLYLKKGRHVFTADVRSKGELFVENATNGQTVESLTFDTDEWTPRRIVIDAVADDTYYLGIKGPDARIRNAVLDRPDPVE